MLFVGCCGMLCVRCCVLVVGCLAFGVVCCCSLSFVVHYCLLSLFVFCVFFDVRLLLFVVRLEMVVVCCVL